MTAPAQSAAGKWSARLVMSLCLALLYLCVEVVVVLSTGSLALLSDAAHMLTDVIGLALALIAIMLAKRAGKNAEHTFGMYRAEVLAALANAILLCGTAIFVVYSAISRIGNPPEIPGLPVLLVSLLGITINVTSFLLLRNASKESLNMKGAYLEVLNDMIGTFGVLVSALITIAIGWPYADLIIGVAIGVFVVPRAIILGRSALRVLFQHAPKELDVAAITTDLGHLDGVAEVHDLHAWTLTSGMDVLSVHLATTPGADSSQVLANAQTLLAEKYKLEHATLQVEAQDSAQKCHKLAW
jgi:cobalt-zinc-cadmium efflux system protein